MTCNGATVCAYVHADEDHIFLGVINDSEDLVYVPWINGVASLASGFVVKKVDGKGSNVSTGGPTPTAIPLVGNTLLVPHSSYGVAVEKEDAKDIFQLKSGCQIVIAEFKAFAPNEDHPNPLVTSAISKPTRICL